MCLISFGIQPPLTQSSKYESVMIYTIGTSFGGNYHNTRVTEPRLAEAMLQKAQGIYISTIADIGSGISNYSFWFANKGYKVLAIEPSAVMIGQAMKYYPHPNIEHIASTAEDMHRHAISAELAICILSLHHFNNLDKALVNIKNIQDLHRVIIFTVDHRLSDGFWFKDYFPEIWRYASTLMIASLEEQINSIQSTFNRKVHVHTWPVPRKCRDQFFGASWEDPIVYTDLSIYENTTPLIKADRNLIDAGISQLQIDIDSGVFFDKYKKILKMPVYDVGHRLIVVDMK